MSISRQTLSQELRAMGFRKLSARPRHHAQNEHAIAAYKNFPGLVEGIAHGKAAGAEIHSIDILASGDVPDRDENEKYSHKLDFVAELAQ